MALNLSEVENINTGSGTTITQLKRSNGSVIWGKVTETKSVAISKIKGSDNLYHGSLQITGHSHYFKVLSISGGTNPYGQVTSNNTVLTIYTAATLGGRKVNVTVTYTYSDN